MRHLIVCCDGTWNTPEQESVTNVRRLYNTLNDTDEDGNEQSCHYQPGVGTSGRLLSRLLGGGAGIGLSRNVMDAYRWLNTRYQAGDSITLFGFSRGAYTARSLAGLVSACGLIETSNLDEATTLGQIAHVYEQYRNRSNDRKWRAELTFRYDPDNHEQIPIRFIGVWDTVGALGIPDYLGGLNRLNRLSAYDFHDLVLNPHIPHARHAVAVDEYRRHFAPTLWSEPFGPGQDVKQVWFPGSHQDVGGGHLQTGLSDGGLLWMIEEARAALRLGFDKTAVDQVRPDAHDVQHNDNNGTLGIFEPLFEPVLKPWLEVLLQSRPRAVPRIDPDRSNQSIHKSVYDRQQTPSITGGRYRPTRSLAPGQTATVEVLAREPWNDTGLYLDADEYVFVAEGAWWDSSIASGPGGAVGLSRFSPAVEKGRLLGTLSGGLESLFRRVPGNSAANFIGARREGDMPWMSLVGIVANDVLPVIGAVNTHERISIGTGTRHRVAKSGYLYAFANDAWAFYGNNQGTVRLTVRRVSTQE